MNWFTCDRCGVSGALAALLFYLAAWCAVAEKIFHQRNHSDIQDLPARQAKVILEPQSAEDFLKKYGYINPVNWEEMASATSTVAEYSDPAPKDVSALISEGQFQSRFGKDMDEDPSLSPEYIYSLKSFQQANGIPITGILDEATKEAMNKPRCGVPDLKVDSNSIVNGNEDPKTETTAIPETDSGGLKRSKRFLDRMVEHTRTKRGNLDVLGSSSNGNLVFSKAKLKWRLLSEGYSLQLSISQQRSVLSTAFRIWSEVIPLQFEEDNTSPYSDIDIKLGFGTGRHLGCSQLFDGSGLEFAHAWYQGDIHFDDDDHFVGTNSDQGISLLKVAVHEIGTPVQHALGLPHNYRTESIMQPNYIPQNNNAELNKQDRKDIQALYGVCEGPFSTVFDWIKRDKTPTGDIVYRFNTYFFRSSWYWMYENKNNRTRYGDPIPITSGWKGIPSADIDAFVHVWTWNKDAQYFFKGTQYWRYDPDNDMTFTEDAQGNQYPKLIVDGFPGVPTPIDAAFFDKRDRNIYFFRGSDVTAFNVDTNQKVYGYPKAMTDVFPATTSGDHPVKSLDAVYFSYTTNSIYFIKDKFYWKVVDDSDRSRNPSYPYNGLLSSKRLSNNWFDICDVHLSVLFLKSS
ncbi:matrix metalloproteinase-21-like [Polypterus senegalus]|uniref:matrix metalloproteinase-21-like n=1 Tax=Polypterus senegalus TaxID=55291 RepID=UPI0019643C0E|nr:matrix metalloproteinase-21-like [Polypterus senegalus]